jgi:hypothetical protein
MKGIGHKDQINRLGPQARDIVSIASNKAAIVTPASFKRTRATFSNVGSMSIAATWRATFAICNVNQPSPEHRSITSMQGFRPTLASTPAGSGHNASHQPAVGISVPSKKPLGLSDISLSYLITPDRAH